MEPFTGLESYVNAYVETFPVTMERKGLHEPAAKHFVVWTFMAAAWPAVAPLGGLVRGSCDSPLTFASENVQTFSFKQFKHVWVNAVFFFRTVYMFR